MSVTRSIGVPEIEQARRLERRLERERCARREAERISETVTRDLFERQQEIALLGEIATAANHASDLGEVIQLTLGKVCAHLSLPLGHAYLREGDEMVPTDIWYVEDAAQTAAFRCGSESRRFGPGEGLPGRVLVDPEPASIGDILRDGNFPRAAEARESGIRGALAFPIVGGPKACLSSSATSRARSTPASSS